MAEPSWTNATSVLEVGQFYGATQERWQTELVTLSVLRHATPRVVPFHAHQHSYFTLLLEGGYRERIGERELVYEPMTLVFHPEGFAHLDEIRVADCRFFAVEMAPALLGPRERDELVAVHDLRGGPAVWAMPGCSKLRARHTITSIARSRSPRSSTACSRRWPRSPPAGSRASRRTCATTRGARSRCVPSPPSPAFIRSMSRGYFAPTTGARCARSSSASAWSTRPG